MLADGCSLWIVCREAVRNAVGSWPNGCSNLCVAAVETVWPYSFAGVRGSVGGRRRHVPRAGLQQRLGAKQRRHAWP